MNPIHPLALFRLTILGSLVSRDQWPRGELQQEIIRLAERDHDIPGSGRGRISAKTIEAWYYAYRREGLSGITPKIREDRGVSKLSSAVQEALRAAKKANPRRSIRQLRRLMEEAGIVPGGTLSRSAIHRFLQVEGLSRPTGSASEPQEHCSFVAEFAGDCWYGDVMHGPKLLVGGRWRKGYLVSLLDDASRLVAHSAFCTSETALDIEGALKQAVLKRGLPRKLVVDNGSAYRASTLQEVCARLGIQLIYCRPYAPEGKGKLERWHRTLRDQFLSEINFAAGVTLDDANSRLWAWIEVIYHHQPHTGIEDLTPLARYQKDLPRIRTLGTAAPQIDEIFYHRISRLVRKDGTVSYQGSRFEVPYELAGQTVKLVVDPHTKQAIRVENAQGTSLGRVTPLNALANNHRTRNRATPVPETGSGPSTGPNLVDIALNKYYKPKGDI